MGNDEGKDKEAGAGAGEDRDGDDGEEEGEEDEDSITQPLTQTVIHAVTYSLICGVAFALCLWRRFCAVADGVVFATTVATQVRKWFKVATGDSW